MEEVLAAVDERFPEVRVSFAMARAEHAVLSANLAAAQKLTAIRSVLAEARAHPEVFAGFSGDRRRDEWVEFAIRGAAEDLAVRLGESAQSIRNQEWDAVTCIRRTPRVWAAFQNGDVAMANLRIVAEHAGNLPDDDPALFAAFDDALLDAAAALPPARLRTKARGVVEKLSAASSPDRHRRAAENRRVWIEPDHDGMATLSAHLPADVAIRAMAGIDAQARRLATDPTETRTLAQLRADLIGETLIGTPGNRAVGVTVAVSVPVLTLLGRRDDPGTIEGYGPISADIARDLAGDATSFIRILTHPISGTVLDIDREAHPVPTDMDRWVRLTRTQCDFPGCGRPATGCDIDHTTAWEHGGPTAIGNLALLCRNHHRIKHNTRWKPTWDDTGQLHWASPTGHVRANDPPPWDIPVSLP